MILTFVRYISTPELFPTATRATSFAICTSFGKLGGLLSPMIFGYLWDSQVSSHVIVMTVSGCFLMAALTAMLLMSETTGTLLRDRSSQVQTKAMGE